MMIVIYSVIMCSFLSEVINYPPGVGTLRHALADTVQAKPVEYIRHRLIQATEASHNSYLIHLYAVPGIIIEQLRTTVWYNQNQ